MSGLVSADLRTELVPIVVVQDQEGVSAASGIGQKVIVIRHGRAADGDAFPIELQRYGAAVLRDTQGLHPNRWQRHAVALGIRTGVSTRLVDKNICSSFLVQHGHSPQKFLAIIIPIGHQ